MKPTYKYILHVDDDEEDYFMLQEAIREVDRSISVGFRSEFSGSLEHLMQSQPDLIFLDINMPAYDGFYWLEEIAKQPHFKKPVIMYSTASTDHYIARAYEAGAHLFLVKPPTFSELVASLRDIFHMNWLYPERIRQHYYQEGQPHCFQLQKVV